MSRPIPDPGFRGDDGTADPEVATALSGYADGTGTFVDALAALQGARLLVPVVALLGEVEVGADGLTHDKTSDMAAVLLTRPDGRRGLLAFTSAEAMTAWNPEARPVPVAATTAARAAVQEQATALVVDVAGPARLAIEGEDLRRLADGWRLASVEGRAAWIRPTSE